MEAHAPVSTEASGPFKLLLFIDKRPNSTEQVRRIRSYLKNFQGSEEIALEIIDVTNQPYLAEHFKLVATPALIRVSADQHQILAGSDIVTQLEHWWPRWQRLAQEQRSGRSPTAELTLSELATTPERDSRPTSGDLSNEFTRGELTSGGVIVDAVAQSTEILRLSDEIFRLNQDKETLTLQIAFKDRIISMMAHDLRNPLTAASIALETLELAYEPNGDRVDKFTPELIAHLLKSTKVQIRTINSMITEILQAARGPSANLQISPQELNLPALCLEVMESFQAKLTIKHQSIDTDLPQDLPDVYADPDQVQRVLVNLIDNAIKYTPAYGQIGITALHRTTEKVQISIRDNGPGIPQDNQKHIFEENFRLKRDHSEDGYGLGLALCQRIVRAHYGQIWVDSKQGEGSCFHFTLPVYKG
jgi:two-component system clock-associated histidine kinase SasA